MEVGWNPAVHDDALGESRIDGPDVNCLDGADFVAHVGHPDAGYVCLNVLESHHSEGRFGRDDVRLSDSCHDGHESGPDYHGGHPECRGVHHFHVHFRRSTF